MKKVNCGNDYLIPKNEWISEKEIQGNDVLVLKSPLMEKAYQKILKDFKPKHDIALISLCTATRPYHKSRKWKEFIKRYSDKADLIICSNGGIIPIEYDECYPYMTYDAHGQKQYDKIYIAIVYKRLMEFLTIHKYKKVVFNFRPGLRNRISARQVVKDFKGDTEFKILPTVLTYQDARKRGFPSGSMFPDLDIKVLEELDKEILNESISIK